MSDAYLANSRQLFVQYKELAEKALAQIDDAALHWQYNEESNSIAVIMKHMWGNMLSRWTNFLTEDGEKSWRNRDTEFEEDAATREELLAAWQRGWDCLFEAFDAVRPDQLMQTVMIRAQAHTVQEAINRQLTHYAYHVGQIVFVARMCSGPEWKSLSVPKKGSEAYNEKMFGKTKKNS